MKPSARLFLAVVGGSLVLGGCTWSKQGAWTGIGKTDNQNAATQGQQPTQATQVVPPVGGVTSGPTESVDQLDTNVSADLKNLDKDLGTIDSDISHMNENP